jgi:hypothetical protein
MGNLVHISNWISNKINKLANILNTTGIPVKINSDSQLLCPKCGYNYLHTHSHENHYGDLLITFWCEGCAEFKEDNTPIIIDKALRLQFHKGNNYLEWVDIPHEIIKTI